MSTTTGSAALAAIEADQLTGMNLPPLQQVSGAPAYLGVSAVPPGVITLSEWFPQMPAIDATGSAEGFLLRSLGMDVAQLAYVNAPAQLSADTVAAMLGGTAYGPVPAGGALLFHGTARLAAFGPLQALAGVPLPDLAMIGRVDFSTGFPRLILTAPLTGPTGPVADLQLSLGSPLFAAPGDASLTLSASVPITATDRVAITLEVIAGEALIATVALDAGTAGRLAGSVTGPGLPSLGATETLALTVQLGRAGGWFTLDRLGFGASVSNWAILPGLVTIDQATLDIQLLDPTGARQVIADVTATATFGTGGLRLAGTGAYPIGAFTLGFADAVTVADVLGEFGIHDAALETLVITTCTLTVARQIGMASAALALAGSWTLGPFTLTSLAVALRRTADGTAGTVSADFTLGGVAFAATASYAAGSWTLSAAAIPGPDGIPLGAVLSALKLPLPGFIDALALDSLVLLWDPQAGASAQIAAILPIGPGARANLTISAGQPALTGQIRLGSIELDMVVQDGSWTATMPPTDLALADLAAAVDLVLPGSIAALSLGQCTMELSYGPAPKAAQS